MRTAAGPLADLTNDRTGALIGDLAIGPLDATAKVAKSSGRGSLPGEHRGGRRKGTPNRATAELKDLARQYTQDALDALVSVVRGQDGAAKVAAARELLDRGYGKPSQVIAGDPNAPLVHEIRRSFVDRS